MCGIIGIVGKAPVAERLVDSLKRLEYRGYDSAGVAAVVGGKVERRRAQGKIKNLEALLAEAAAGRTERHRPRPLGHPRRAQRQERPPPHRRPRDPGAQRHHRELRRAEGRAGRHGRTFESDTDTEVIAQLIDAELATGLAPLDAFKATLDRLTGAYALAVLIEGADDLILGARRGSPLVVGEGQGEMFLGSDALAVGPFTNRVVYLEEGDYVAIDHDSAKIFDASGAPVSAGRSRSSPPRR
jgi:glucosamine--fructose-6-phosphate aminotransferase (isomerizing)